MKTRFCIAIAATIACAHGASADLSANYGWEDGGLILGGYNNDNMAYASNTNSNHVFAGDRSLALTEVTSQGTPQTFVAFITGLSEGDVIYGSFWAWDDSEGGSPSVRIWASYATSDDITNYSGSAGGNSTYSSGTAENPWSELNHEWTFNSSGGERDALVIQVRMYNADDGDTLYVDDMNINVSGADLSGVVINTPVPAPGALALLGLAGFARRRRR